MNRSSTQSIETKAFQMFLRNNWKALALGLLIGVIAFFSWCYWQKYQGSCVSISSASYQDISQLFFNEKYISEPNISKAEKFIQKNYNNYSGFIALQLAKKSVENQFFDKSEQQLISALLSTKDNNMLSLIYLRLARVQLQLKQFDKALKSLDNIYSDFWLGIAESIRGDILLEKNDIAGARAAYKKSIESSIASSQLLHLKLNNLSA
ncbi:YfgM family protein [Candidatus Williamhamiltonella defendens]|uniref:YfgM family protein n=1 Tax=Candidatus Williamhamiltonella defendens TaxID=138072 RepID=UPI00130E3191|nr:tetratricopeptide repeat protein [Candidatus Hamiltonella defensa]